MIRYLNKNNRSNVKAYEIGTDHIDVEFLSGAIYRYSNRVTGVNNVENLKKLAKEGCGLNSYIKRYCDKLYECRLK